MRKQWIKTVLTILVLISATTLIYLYTSGYRISKPGINETNIIDIKRTGLISAKSVPDGAKVYINDVLYTATNDTISSLDPGEYRLKIVKNGYVPWSKTVEVFEELVTDITAVLISQTPRLEPLTNTGARVPVVSQSLSKLAYFSKDGENSGIWVIPLSNNSLNIFGSSPYVAIEDEYNLILSNGISLEWSPDEDQLLVQHENENYYLVDINTQVVESTASPDLVRSTWMEELKEDRADFFEKIELPEDIVEIANDKDTLWSPDGKKFLYKVQSGDTLQYKVYNMEKPLPVGEKIDSIVFTTNINEDQPKVSWYADSFHLILTENYVAEEQRGVISLIRIDGTNKTEIYGNNMYSDRVYSTPGGDKLIFLTSFKSNEQTDLYTIGIR